MTNHMDGWMNHGFGGGMGLGGVIAILVVVLLVVAIVRVSKKK